MSNWIAAPLAILFFVGFIWFMSNRKKLVNQAREKMGMEPIVEEKKTDPELEKLRGAIAAKKAKKPVAPAVPAAPAEKAGE